MIVVGKVSKGTVILPPDAHLPEGAEVEVRPVAAGSRHERVDKLRQLAGAVEGLPADLAKNHDHYLYGTPRK